MLQYKYFILILLVGSYFLTELIIGIYANSITLQTDAFHMLSDLFALCVGAGALLMLDRERHHRFTYGWLRAEIIAGMINSVFLLAVCFMLTIENITKLIELANDTTNSKLESEIDLVLGVAVGGLIINLIGLFLFHNEHAHSHSHSHTDTEDIGTVIITKTHNYAQAAVLLHIIGDALGSVLVIASGLCIKYIQSPWKFYIDPVISLLIIIFINIGSVKILIDCIKILMHHWKGKPIKDIENEILQVEGVAGIHDFHIWSLNGKFSIATVHIQLLNVLRKKRSVSNTDTVLTKVKEILHAHGIHCSCIQPEWTKKCIEPTCDNDCNEKRCCSNTLTELIV